MKYFLVKHVFLLSSYIDVLFLFNSDNEGNNALCKSNTCLLNKQAYDAPCISLFDLF